MKTIFFFLLFTGHIFAQNTQITNIPAGDTFSNRGVFSTKNDSGKNTIEGTGKTSTLNTESYKVEPFQGSKIYNENITLQDYPEFAYSFGIGTSFMIKYRNSRNEYFSNYYENKKKPGYCFYFNSGKRLSENFMLKAEVNFIHNTFEEYSYYYNYTYSQLKSAWSVNVLVNGTLGVFDSPKYLFYAIAGLGLGLNSADASVDYNLPDGFNFLTDFGIGGGIKISKNFSLTCDLMFNLHFAENNEYMYFTPRVGLSFIPY